MFLCWLTSSRIAFQEILRKALQHAAGFVDQHFFGGVQTAGDGHFYGFAVGAVNHQSELAARDAFADHVVGFGAVQFKRFAVGAGQKLPQECARLPDGFQAPLFAAKKSCAKRCSTPPAS